MWLAAMVGFGSGLFLDLCASRLARRLGARRLGLADAMAYSLLPLLCAAIGVYLQRAYGWSLLWAVQMVYCGLLLLIGLVDLQYSRIPNVLVGTGMVLALVFSVWHGLKGPLWGGPEGPLFWGGTPSIASALAGAVLGGGIFSLLAVVRRNAMGVGDVKLAALIGMMTGFPWVLQALTLGILVGGLAAALFLVARLRRRNQYMPYAPYLVVGCLATLLYGQRIAAWYAHWLVSGG